MYNAGDSTFSEESSRGHCQTKDTGLKGHRSVLQSHLNHREKSLREVRELVCSNLPINSDKLAFSEKRVKMKESKKYLFVHKMNYLR